MTRIWRTLVGGTSAAVVAAGMLAVGAAPAPADVLGYDTHANKGSLWQVKQVVGANAMHASGWTGKGVGVALVDTGVTPVQGLDSGNVWNGPDLSFDSQDPELAHLDAFGHGTHLAGIIAGRDLAGTPASYAGDSRFTGVAPDANLVNVKVGASDGAVDVSQVIAGIDWVVEHRNDPGLNIRVLNLSYGTDSVQPGEVDPLVFAVERAWKAGIVVVVAGGNDGRDTELLADPARSPYVVAVGADDTQGTLSARDDVVPDWATRGTNDRHVDVVAPGVSVLGLRNPGGYVDSTIPGSRTGQRFARASGTSQAAAVVSGEVALLLQARPTLKPDQVKAVLRATADVLPGVDVKFRGNGLTRVDLAAAKAPGSARQPDQFWSTGLGSLEAARGTSHVYDGVQELRGEVDIFGRPWDAATWTAASAAQTAWVGGTWRGATWSGDAWNARTWRDVLWTSGTWSARTWRSGDWSARTWRDGRWTSADGFSARTWRDAGWDARTWRSAQGPTGWEQVAWQ